MARKKTTLTFTNEEMFWISEALLRLMDNPSRRVYLDPVYVYGQCQDLLNNIKKHGYLQFRYEFDATMLRSPYVIKMAEILRNHESTYTWLNPPTPIRKPKKRRVGRFPHYDPDDFKKKKTKRA